MFGKAEELREIMEPLMIDRKNQDFVVVLIKKPPVGVFDRSGKR